MFKTINKLLNTQMYKFVKGNLKFEIPKGIWHTLNHYIMSIFQKRFYKYSKKINKFFFKNIIAFLITMYEFDAFSKIMIAVGLSENEKTQADFYSTITRDYILRWLPGMLTSRIIMARDFVRSTPAKSSIVRYNLKYMKSTVYKLYNKPDLLILNTLNGMGSIVAKEATIVKLPTIGLATNESFPYKIAFKFYGEVNDFNFIKSFIYILMYSMVVGKSLFYKNNFCRSLFNYNLSVSEVVDWGKPQIIERKNQKNNNEEILNKKQYNISESFRVLKKFNYKLTKIKKHKILNFYSTLNFKTKINRSTQHKNLKLYKMLPMLLKILELGRFSLRMYRLLLPNQQDKTHARDGKFLKAYRRVIAYLKKTNKYKNKKRHIQKVSVSKGKFSTFQSNINNFSKFKKK